MLKSWKGSQGSRMGNSTTAASTEVTTAATENQPPRK